MNRSERLYIIDQMLGTGRAVPIEEFLARLEVSPATFKRDLEYLRDRLQAPIVWNQTARGYLFGQASGVGPRYELPGLWFSAKELFALLAAQKNSCRHRTGRSCRTRCSAPVAPLLATGNLWSFIGRSEPPCPLAIHGQATHRTAVLRRHRVGAVLSSADQGGPLAPQARRYRHSYAVATAIGALPRQLVSRCLVPFAQRTAELCRRNAAARNRSPRGRKGDRRRNTGCPLRNGLRHLCRCTHGDGQPAFFGRAGTLGAARNLA
jgi:hypothetical protein